MSDDLIRPFMDENVVIAYELADSFHYNNNQTSCNYKFFGKDLYENWDLKQRFQSDISNAFIDRINDVAIANGATGGKITGAGSGGFYICIVPQIYQHKVKIAITSQSDSITFMPAKIDPYGSRVLMNVEEYQWG